MSVIFLTAARFTFGSPKNSELAETLLELSNKGNVRNVFLYVFLPDPKLPPLIKTRHLDFCSASTDAWKRYAIRKTMSPKKPLSGANMDGLKNFVLKLDLLPENHCNSRTDIEEDLAEKPQIEHSIFVFFPSLATCTCNFLSFLYSITTWTLL